MHFSRNGEDIQQKLNALTVVTDSNNITAELTQCDIRTLLQ